MKKRILIGIIITIVIIAFLFPKPAGESGHGYSIVPPSGILSWVDTECSCFGYKYDANRGRIDAPSKYKCIGIAYSCECTKHNLNVKTDEDNIQKGVCS